jgi:hypothetical protein
MGTVRAILVGLIMVVGLWGCGYHDLQGLGEGTKAAWSEIVNQYQSAPCRHPQSCCRGERVCGA